MRNFALPIFFGALALASNVAFGQGMRGWRETSFVPTPRGDWAGERLPDGQPDVSGHWSNTIGNHNNLTDPQGPLGVDDEAPRQNSRQNTREPKPRSERAPSRVSDPPDGEIPLKPWARAKQREFLKYLNNPIKPEYVEPFARCAPGGPSKSFMWHGYEIRQFPGYVVFLFDSGNRVIHLDGKPHLPANLKLWNGDSRGHWEGNTLVVDTTNNNSKARLGRTGEFVSENATIQEFFIFDPNGNRFTYQAAYTDPTVLTRPFTITIPNRRITDKTPADDWNNLTFPAKHAGNEPVIEAYERICVEGNGNHGQPAAATH
ncbi:MAG: hypothetical protein JO307_19925 [Bryobacterales bacterium]|nr:hypothetical protein [Bryobacterales bacterium]MBV9399451.1 hypothetical protein [Bryobacterales bacterium]